MDAEHFDQHMKRFQPFEKAPHIAVGVSGGADSLALAILLSEWSLANGGRMTALIVDHGLREESAAEASAVSRQLFELNIENVILTWSSSNIKSGIQAHARSGRYGLMEDWCRKSGVLHLAIAHHADDQAETFLMRLQKGSGPDGLSGIPRSRELTHCRIIRPLLDTRKEALISYLRAMDITWVEDPSNADQKFARSQVRETVQSKQLDVAGIVLSADRYARAREAAEVACAEWLARHGDLRPSGYLRMNKRAFFRTPDDVRLRILSRAATVIGGKTYPPAIHSVERLDESLERGRSSTVSAALFDVHGDEVIVCRENRNLPEPMRLSMPSTRWDGRFQIDIEPEVHRVKVLAFRCIAKEESDGFDLPKWFSNLPYRVRPSFPVFRLGDEILFTKPNSGEKERISLKFSPKIPLSGMGFSVA